VARQAVSLFAAAAVGALPKAVPTDFSSWIAKRRAAARMAYVGPKDERTERLILRFLETKVARAANNGLRPAGRAALAQCCVDMPEKHFKVLQKLATFGFFQAGGVLIGTHAFVAMGNMLALRCQRAFMTMAIDFAHAGKCISIALPADMCGRRSGYVVNRPV